MAGSQVRQHNDTAGLPGPGMAALPWSQPANLNNQLGTAREPQRNHDETKIGSAAFLPQDEISL